MQNIKDLTLEELRQILKNWDASLFHAKQIFDWIYKKQIADFNLMSNLPLELRNKLKKNFYLFDLKLTNVLKSKDGTQKFLLELKDGNLIEAVIIPTEKRITGCISTQVGCKFACKFCASGLLGFKRNLTPAEMLDEILYLKNNSQDKKFTPLEINCNKTLLRPAKAGLSLTGLTHLVFMGMGEPLDNYDNVLKTIRIINSPDTFNIGSRRITISTCGIIPQVKKLADEGLQIELSISLHAGDDKTRSLIMPINKIYPLKDLISVCKDYIKKTNRQITFEYVLIRGINSSLPDAQKLSTMLRDLKLYKVNLIPVNSIKEHKIEPPGKLDILLFRDYLLKQHINVTLRRPRGQDIEAACGQLRLRYEEPQITQI